MGKFESANGFEALGEWLVALATKLTSSTVLPYMC
jgi:hypothetical protein